MVKSVVKKPVKKTGVKKIAPPKAAAVADLSKFPLGASDTQDVGLSKFTESALKVYGSYVVENRAVPDFRDGLKPSHRAVLWSMVGLGLRPSGGCKKTARTVGDVIGKYHPHGDKSSHDAMATIVNTVPPFVEGQGGWGSPNTPPAAMRYSEAKLSKFAHAFLVDPEYLKVVPYEPNFSNDDVLPLYLPALLPTLLFVTSIPAPAYGVRAGNPAFSLRSVTDVVVRMLNGEKFDAQQLADSLETKHPFGCVDVSKDSDIVELMATGKGKVTYMPLIEHHEKQREIHIRSFAPTTLSNDDNINKTLAKISEIEGVRNAFSRQGKKVKGAGPYGALFVVECQKNISDERFDEIGHSVERIIQTSVSYRLGITVRKQDESNEFRYLNFVQYLNAWVKYRTKLELRLVEQKTKIAQEQLHLFEVYLFAIENMDKLLKALPKVLVAANPDKALAKALRIPEDDARIILDRKVRQLAKMEAGALKEKIKELQAELKQLARDAKRPAARAALVTQDRVEKYLKSPDFTQSGIPV